ncbi:MAG TPA: class I SAM-dependent methyltransferase [Vicinamibacterales bacterium]
MDPLAQFKAMQKEGWSHFVPLEVWTTGTAARLVNHATVRAGQRLLDVACGTGVVAITAARRGARATGLDLTPALLARAREHATIAGVEVDFHEGDVETLPFEDASFDVVVSQFGHMFAPRPDVALREMLRVLKPGGTLAFSTWPPEQYVARVFTLVAQYMPPPPIEAPSPALWGDPDVIRERLGDAVRDIAFARDAMFVTSLSPQHSRMNFERTAGPVIQLVATLSGRDPERLAQFRREFETLVTEYLDDNILRQDYLMTRAIKV